MLFTSYQPVSLFWFPSLSLSLPSFPSGGGIKEREKLQLNTGKVFSKGSRAASMACPFTACGELSNGWNCPPVCSFDLVSSCEGWDWEGLNSVCNSSDFLYVPIYFVEMGMYHGKKLRDWTQHAQKVVWSSKQFSVRLLMYAKSETLLNVWPGFLLYT